MEVQTSSPGASMYGWLLDRCSRRGFLRGVVGAAAVASVLPYTKAIPVMACRTCEVSCNYCNSYCPTCGPNPCWSPSGGCVCTQYCCCCCGDDCNGTNCAVYASMSCCDPDPCGIYGCGCGFGFCYFCYIYCG